MGPQGPWDHDLSQRGHTPHTHPWVSMNWSIPPQILFHWTFFWLLLYNYHFNGSLSQIHLISFPAPLEHPVCFRVAVCYTFINFLPTTVHLRPREHSCKVLDMTEMCLQFQVVWHVKDYSNYIEINFNYIVMNISSIWDARSLLNIWGGVEILLWLFHCL